MLTWKVIQLSNSRVLVEDDVCEQFFFFPHPCSCPCCPLNCRHPDSLTLQKCISAPITEHLQQRPGVHALLLGRLLHVQTQVLENLDGAHLLSRRFVIDSWARGVAVGPRAAVDQMERTTPRRRGLVLLAVVAYMAAVGVVALLQASVPAVEGSGKGGPFHSDIYPVAAEAEVTGGRDDNLRHFKTSSHKPLPCCGSYIGVFGLQKSKNNAL